MNCMTRSAINLVAAAAFGFAFAGTALAQVTYARGDAVWNNTFVAVPGAANCLSCHASNTAQLGTIRIRYASLTQVQVRTRIDQAFAGQTGMGVVTPMAGVYPGTTISSNDRDALTLYLGNFIPIAATAASTPLTSLTSPAVGTMATSTLTVTNTGRLPLTVSAMTFSGANAADFSRMPVGTGCVAQTIAVNANCQESIRFTPAATGTRTATLTIAHDGEPNTTVLPLSGSTTTGAPPPIGSGGGGGGGAVWPWALLLVGAAALRRRRAD